MTKSLKYYFNLRLHKMFCFIAINVYIIWLHCRPKTIMLTSCRSYRMVRPSW